MAGISLEVAQTMLDLLAGGRDWRWRRRRATRSRSRATPEADPRDLASRQAIDIWRASRWRSSAGRAPQPAPGRSSTDAQSRSQRKDQPPRPLRLGLKGLALGIRAAPWRSAASARGRSGGGYEAGAATAGGRVAGGRQGAARGRHPAGSAETLRGRSRDLERNHPLALGAIQTKTNGVVGTGLKLRSVIDGEVLGIPTPSRSRSCSTDRARVGAVRARGRLHRPDASSRTCSG
jgi:hypothetical protein